MINPVVARQLRQTNPAELADQYAEWCTGQFAREDGLPVVIAARDEASDLPATLVALARSDLAVRPIVVENGSVDNTAAVARRMGAIVLASPVIGKVPALQMGSHLALDELKQPDILYTDADTLVGRHWAGTYASVFASTAARPTILCGSTVIAHGVSRPADLARTAYGFGRDLSHFVTGRTPVARGNNMAIGFDAGDRLRQQYNRLRPELFGAEETAMVDIVKLIEGGIVRRAAFVPALAISRGDRFASVGDVVNGAKAGSRQSVYRAQYAFAVPYDGTNAFRSLAD